MHQHYPPPLQCRYPPQKDVVRYFSLDAVSSGEGLPDPKSLGKKEAKKDK